LKKVKGLFGFLSRKAKAKKNVFSYEPDPSRVLCACDFNTDLCEWVTRGPLSKMSLSLTSKTKRSGNNCLKISGRGEAWHGASLDITKYIKEGIRHYEAMAWVKVPDDAASCKVYLSLETNSKMGGVVFPYYTQWADFDDENGILSKYRLPVGGIHGEYAEWETTYPKGYVTSDGWVLLRGKIEINHAEHFRAFVYIETNDQGKNNDVYVDDFVLMKGTAAKPKT